MNILISGCSFTQWGAYPGGPNTCWPRYLSELDSTLNIKSVAEAAAGNQFICDSVIREIVYNPNTKYDMVLVMWSGVSRLDFLTSVEDPTWNEMFQSYGFFRILSDVGGKLGYIFSGGQLGTWYGNPVAHKMFKEQYKVSSELSLATINLMEMVKLQNFLKAKGVPFKFMCYVNYWTNEPNVSRNGDFGLYRHKELRPLINELDWDKFIFLNDKKETLYDLAKHLDSFQEDGFHPGEHAHKEWAELVYKNLKN